MRVIPTALLLVSLTIAAQGAQFERQEYTLEIPEGWREGPPINTIMVAGPEGRPTAPLPARIMTDDCSVVVTLLPKSGRTSAKGMTKSLVEGFRRLGSVIKESTFTTLGGREGFGSQLHVRRNSITSTVQQVFSTEDAAFVCTFQITTTGRSEEEVLQVISYRKAGMEALVRSLKIKPAAAAASR